MSFAGIDTLTEFLVALASVLAAVRWLVMPLRRMVALYEAQLGKNGGGSLTDKAAKMYADMFPAEGPSMREMLTSITDQQQLTADLMNDQNKATIARLDRVEAEIKAHKESAA